MGSWPNNVGIIAIELIFPSQYVDQTQLESYDGVTAGKYTIGLGQAKMGFCTDREDINSLCLTVVQNLIDRHHLKLSDIGRLEVGTETIIDKSKSVKSVLMQLFEPHGVTDIEGIDTTNACYGGTAALFNAVSWVESSAWDGRYAIVVAADIAVYAEGSARPTGGAGAIAMLVGPNAPLVFERGMRASYMRHAYDFYKPDMSSEYPTVDGKLSIQCYLQALDNCYQAYCKKASKLHPDTQVSLDYFDGIVFHSPYCKLVQKSLARLLLNDVILSSSPPAALQQYGKIRLEDTYFDRTIEKAFMDASKEIFTKKTKQSLLVANQVGNMYTPSVYSCLISFLISKDVNNLVGNRIGLFSYGSGLASTFYSLKVTDNPVDSQLNKLIDGIKNVKSSLEKRHEVQPADFASAMKLREQNGHAAPYKPQSDVETLFPGTYYLENVDEMHRRTYKRRPANLETTTNGTATSI